MYAVRHFSSGIVEDPYPSWRFALARKNLTMTLFYEQLIRRCLSTFAVAHCFLNWRVIQLQIKAIPASGWMLVVGSFLAHIRGGLVALLKLMRRKFYE